MIDSRFLPCSESLAPAFLSPFAFPFLSTTLAPSPPQDDWRMMEIVYQPTSLILTSTQVVEINCSLLPELRSVLAGIS